MSAMDQQTNQEDDVQSVQIKEENEEILEINEGINSNHIENEDNSTSQNIEEPLDDEFKYEIKEEPEELECVPDTNLCNFEHTLPQEHDIKEELPSDFEFVSVGKEEESGENNFKDESVDYSYEHSQHPPDEPMEQESLDEPDYDIPGTSKQNQTARPDCSKESSEQMSSRIRKYLKNLGYLDEDYDQYERMYDSEDETAESTQIEEEEEGEEEEDDDALLKLKNIPATEALDEPVPQKVFRGRDGYTWASLPKTAAINGAKQNVFISGPSNYAKDLGANINAESVWRLLFSSEILEEIVKWTNQKMNSIRSEMKNPDYHQADTDEVEISAFLGLLILLPIFKSSHEDLDSIFSCGPSGRPIFRSTMSYKRFKSLLVALRFDDSTTRSQRRTEDKICEISSIFKQLISNSQKLYVPSEHTCADGMLVPFRGHCPFKITMPNKVAKYGIKFMCLTDAKTSYLYNAFICCGKSSYNQGLSSEEIQLSKPTKSVIRLAQPILNSHRNITANNWFTSIETVNELKNRGLTFVGTLCKNKRHIPPEFQPSPSKKVGSVMYGFREDKTLISYVPKKGKVVILVSSLHKQRGIINFRPEIVEFYNETKSGVETLDFVCSDYANLQRSSRWSMAVFFAMLNISAVNAFVLHSLLTGDRKLKIFKFLEGLGMLLIKPHALRRLQGHVISNDLQNLIRQVHGLQAENRLVVTDRSEKRKTCKMCHYTKKRRTNYQCIKCYGPICLEHSLKVCKHCVS